MKKKIISIVIGTLLMAGCARNYEPGDYYSGEGYDAVVVTVDAENQPLMLMSLDEASSLSADSAMRWVETLGEGWRLPDKNELSKMERVRSLINNTLQKKGLPKVFVDFTYFWSSTPCSESHTYACGPDGLNCYFSENASSSYRARGVRNINNDKTLKNE